MGERERQLLLICRVYEKFMKDAGLFEKASNKAFRALQIRDIVNCKDENFKAFLAGIAQIKPEEYVEYYEMFELPDEKEARFNDTGTGTIVGEPADTYGDFEDPDELFCEDCETCVYFNDNDDTCENLETECTYKKKTED